MDLIRVERTQVSEATVATVWLNRPERMNALSGEMWDGLRDTFVTLKGEADVRVILIRSQVEKAFCTGLDLSSGADPGPDGLRAKIRSYQDVFSNIETHPVPVVAVLHGFVFGGGLELALACDIRIASDDVTMGLTEAKMGIIPASGGTRRLARYVGQGRAKYMILTGEKIDAQKAYAWGLIDELVPRASLDESTTKLTEKLVRAAPLPQRFCKELVRKSMEVTGDAASNNELDAMMEIAKSRDLMEGFTSFMQKRAPRWRGR